MRIRKISFLLLLSWMLFTCSKTWAQSGKIPPFQMMQASGKIFKAQDLPMGKPIVIIYFSPECDHCEKMVKELMKRQADFKKASIAMVTYLPVEKVSKFVNQYALNKHSNIYVGTEGYSFFLKNYYKIMEMPFIALYTKNGDFIKSYSREIIWKELSDKLNNLK